jgi:nucleoside-diphosphate-sugar epimerase
VLGCDWPTTPTSSDSACAATSCRRDGRGASSASSVNFSDLFDAVGPFDLVYHCAAEFGRWNGEDFYEQLWRTNAVGTKNVIRLQEE